MPQPISSACVIGDGAMGTLCALVLAKRGTQVTLWGRSPEHVQKLAEDRENKRYLPGHRFSEAIRNVSDPADAFGKPDLIVSAVPCQYVRDVWSRLAPHVPRSVPIVSTAKGIEIDSLKLPTEILTDCLGNVPTCCLSGPNIAPEIANELPASAVAASKDVEAARLVQRAFSTDRFRVYTSMDLVGVEIAGAAKNVIAMRNPLDTLSITCRRLAKAPPIFCCNHSLLSSIQSRIATTVRLGRSADFVRAGRNN